MKPNTYLNLSHLKQMAGNDPTMIKVILQELLQTMSLTNLQRGHQLYQARDWVGLNNWCHYNKNTFDYTGHAGITRTNNQLWAIARAKSDPQQNGSLLLTQLEQQWKAVRRALERHI